MRPKKTGPHSGLNQYNATGYHQDKKTDPHVFDENYEIIKEDKCATKNLETWFSDASPAGDLACGTSTIKITFRVGTNVKGWQGVQPSRHTPELPEFWWK